MGPSGAPPGASAWPVDSAPASAALRVSWTTRCATPSWISGSGALGTPSASNGARQRGGKARRVGQVDRRRRDARAQAAGERPAVLGVREAVEGDRPEQVEQRPDGVGLEHHRVVAGSQHRRLGGDGRRACGTLGQGPRIEPGGRDRAAGGVAAATAARVDADHLHEGVGEAVDGQCVARGDRGLHLAGGPDAVGLQAGRAGGVEGGRQRGAAVAGLERGRRGVVARVRAPGPGRGEAGVRAGTGGRQRRLGGGRGAAGAAGQRGVVGGVGGGPPDVAAGGGSRSPR